MSEDPHYVAEALAGLTRDQAKYVIAGCLHGDFTITMARTLQRKALFYLHIDSPNGRFGTLRLTPLGVTVQGILKARAAKAVGPRASAGSGSSSVAARQLRDEPIPTQPHPNGES